MEYKVEKECESCYSRTGLRAFKIVNHYYTVCYVCEYQLLSKEEERVEKR